jgi:hypothetical protein
MLGVPASTTFFATKTLVLLHHHFFHPHNHKYSILSALEVPDSDGMEFALSRLLLCLFHKYKIRTFSTLFLVRILFRTG